jgi:hypothetical protein
METINRCVALQATYALEFFLRPARVRLSERSTNLTSNSSIQWEGLNHTVFESVIGLSQFS